LFAALLYGNAEFKNGNDEVDDDKAVFPTSHHAMPTTTSNLPFSEAVSGSTEGYSVMQKAFFLGVILGCIGIYLRMNSKKNQRRFPQKSLV